MLNVAKITYSYNRGNDFYTGILGFITYIGMYVTFFDKKIYISSKLFFIDWPLANIVSIRSTQSAKYRYIFKQNFMLRTSFQHIK